MTDILSASGVVATAPEHKLVGNGISRLTFRLASQQRRYNRSDGAWENGETNWYSVVAFRRLADNAAGSIVKGDRVVVSGRLRTNEWEREGQRTVTVELLADALGHDLAFGTSRFTRGVPAAATTDTTTSTTMSTTPGGDAPATGEESAPPAEVAVVDADGWAVPVARDRDISADPVTAAGAASATSDAFTGTTPF
jgi:single-strand DNA-binding protein